MVYRIFVRRKDGFDNEGERLTYDLSQNLQINGLESVSVINRYDVEGIDDSVLDRALRTVFSEPQTDVASFTLDTSKASRYFIFEYLPGQFDQRADSCEQCIALLMDGIRPRVKSGKVYLLHGTISDEEFAKIKSYVINPVEGREASEELPETLKDNLTPPTEVAILDGFISVSDEELVGYIKQYGLAMDKDDIKFCREYFRDEEGRDPTITELRLIDSYWSDHCRHTTFLTEITSVDIAPDYIKETYADYIAKREFLYAGKNRPVTLMDMATIAAKYLKRTGVLKNLDESEEINACSVKIKAKVDGEVQDWLLMFKNETHNHPTEIEPFGGAATCLGGAIRDPLSGRAYVYQAMRVTGAADPRTPVADTIPGKLPQSKITLGAASGYSSYGNQIGLATGGVYEVYHPGYVAKRMEIGAVVGATPESHVIRKTPEAGDLIILLGGRTGRDGCGGATGSSKAHTSDSLMQCGAEVQKGNPPEERKIQRLFRRGEVTRLIKRCNDFGAGGVSVAIGELADGITVDLNSVPKKYEGLDGTELAISESQERMAVVVADSDAAEFIRYAESENLQATIVAIVTKEPRLTMNWMGKTIVSLSREFLSSNGAPKHTCIAVPAADTSEILDGKACEYYNGDMRESVLALMGDLNVCSQRGLSERFDSSIGASTVVMPFGGKNQLTAPQYMAAKLPVSGETETASYMAYGYDPYLSSVSPYHGALYATVHSAAKLTAAGLDYANAYLTYQEYFERTKGDPARWGKPFSALLGAYRAQLELGIGSIGGKDSMSGTFEDIDVPPTLVSFAVEAADASAAVTPEFKAADHYVYLAIPEYDKDGIVKFDSLRNTLDYAHSLTESGKAVSAYAVGFGGIAEAVAKMSFGNGIGFTSSGALNGKELFRASYGALVLELKEELSDNSAILIGKTNACGCLAFGDSVIDQKTLCDAWQSPLEAIFPTGKEMPEEEIPAPQAEVKSSLIHSATTFAKPRAVIPVFPGTNCEYDSARALTEAGAVVSTVVLRNNSAAALAESIDELSRKINESQILMLPGGFSGGDEPDGSGKFITAVLRNPSVREAVTALTKCNDGLILGICNGFQALLKSGLLPFGEIKDEMDSDDATLTFNTIGRHQSKMVRTRIATLASPWLSMVDPDEIYMIPISHGEGRFIAPPALLETLRANGQIAMQYCDEKGNPSMSPDVNPNGSMWAIEGIISPDGRILGKMGHSERRGLNVARNIPGEKIQPIFESGVSYFK